MTETPPIHSHSTFAFGATATRISCRPGNADVSDEDSYCIVDTSDDPTVNELSQFIGAVWGCKRVSEVLEIARESGWKILSSKDTDRPSSC